MENLIRSLYILFALTLSCYIGVDFFYTAVAEKLRPVKNAEPIAVTTQENRPTVKPALNQFTSIAEKNMFGIVGKGQEEQSNAAESEAIVPTSLNLELLGTGAVSDEESAVAVIRDTALKKQDFYRVGDTIQGAVVKKIARAKVIIRVGSRDEVLTMEKEAAFAGGKELQPSRQPFADSGPIRLSRAEMEDSMKNVNRLLSHARIRPYFKDGKPDGLSISQIAKDSLFQRLGFKDGDILQGIDGKSIKSPDDVMGLYQKLRSEPKVSLQIRRGGQQKTMEYRFER